ncbi:Hypothetical protein NTJ_05962 [Nesidiocoris tenuis]|nr:Hypothetical protein NTJ_05962 [Nesidiocoris tenuis]
MNGTPRSPVARRSLPMKPVAVSCRGQYSDHIPFGTTPIRGIRATWGYSIPTGMHSDASGPERSSRESLGFGQVPDFGDVS